MAKRKARKRLKSVRVDEISFVDRPAVPKGKFLILKRDDTMADDSQVAEIETPDQWIDLLKGSDVWDGLPQHVQVRLQEDAEGDEIEIQLQALPKVLQAVADAVKALEMIEDAPEAVGVVAKELKAVMEKYPMPEKASHPPRGRRDFDPYPPPSPPFQKSLLDEAGEQIVGKQEQKAAEGAGKVGERLSAVLEKVDTLTQKLEAAQGKG